MKYQKNIYSSYKLLKHLDRLLMWEKKGVAYPISVDLDLTNKCNNKCPLCVTSQNRNRMTIAFNTVKDIVTQLKRTGVKAIVLAGGGEPTCHPNIAEIIRFIKKKGIEVALNTNAYQLSKNTIDATADCCTWVRISLDADCTALYKKTHNMGEEAFNRVIDNISKLVDAKIGSKSNIVIGATYLVGPHTINGIYNAAKLCKRLGIDNLRFRFFRSARRFTKKEEKEMFDQLMKCKRLEDRKFFASYPEDRFKSALKRTPTKYKECYVPHVVTSITPDLKVYPCCFLKNVQKYCLGDLTKKSFEGIWYSEKRKRVSEIVDMGDCPGPDPCKFERDNGLLHLIKEPIVHSNFL